MRFRGLLLVSLLAALVAPGVAGAFVRTAAVTDPKDASAADLKSLEVEYDSVAGTLTVVATFYESVASRKDDTNVRFHLGALPGANATCVHSAEVPLATGLMFVRQGVDLLELERNNNVMQSTSSSLSADGTTFTARWASRAALRGFDYRCADVSSVFMTTYTNPSCNYLSCPTTDSELDPVYKETWFDGFAPVPAAPTNVIVSSAAAESVSLQWQEDDSSVTGYEVLRDGAVVGTTDKKAFTLSGLSCGKSYAFTVRADTPYTHSSETGVSAATAACAPKAPAHLSVRAASTSVTVSWGAAANATGYVVVVGSHTYRTKTTHVTVPGLRCGQRVTVTVRAVGPGGTSAPAVAAARTRHC